MIEIVSHRGHWKSEDEKNQEVAFRRSFSMGFGTEFDVRDWDGALCIAHDVPTNAPLLFHDFLQCFSEHDINLPLFLNIKSDGLETRLVEVLQAFSIPQCFVFDMSTPEMVRFSKNGQLQYLTRMSDLETTPLLIEGASGIWVDQFFHDGPAPEQINQYLRHDQLACFVSPELHGRPHKPFWTTLKQWQETNLFKAKRIILCTDLPADAANFFKKETCNESHQSHHF